MDRIHYIVALSLSLFCTSAIAQTFSADRDKIEAANKKLEAPMLTFERCLPTGDADSCTAAFLANAQTPFEKYIAGAFLYKMAPGVSFNLLKAAWQAAPDNLYTNYEYAIGLHRQGKYKEATEIYLRCMAQMPGDVNLCTWLADCYINTGDIPKAIEYWGKAGHADHHTSIENDIYIIYGHPDQPLQRNELRKQMLTGNKQAFYALVYKDMNWEMDWWNKQVIHEFLEADMALAKSKFTGDDADYKAITAYVKLKQLSGEDVYDTLYASGLSTTNGHSDSIKALLSAAHLLVDGAPIPPYGPVTSDMLRICFNNKALPENEFYKRRGDELLEMAKARNDVELLNIYAYLQIAVKGHVEPSIDKLGWQQFHDERFAVSYFARKGEKADDNELTEAIKLCPSPVLISMKAYKAKMNNKPVKEQLIEIIRLEFRTLSSDLSGHFSNGLNSYFGLLAQEK